MKDCASDLQANVKINFYFEELCCGCKGGKLFSPTLYKLHLLIEADNTCIADRSRYLTDVCEALKGRRKRSEFEDGPTKSRSSRQAFSTDVENPRHVVDRAETDSSGFRSPTLDQKLWPGGTVPYKLDNEFSKITIVL